MRVELLAFVLIINFVLISGNSRCEIMEYF